MLDSSNLITLQNFARHLLRQQGSAAIVSEFIRDLRNQGISVYYPASANLANKSDDIDLDEPIIFHLPGESSRTIVLGLETTVYNPHADSSYFEPDEAEENYETASKGKYIYGPGAISVVAPLTIASWLLKQLKEMKEKLPGHFLVVLAPNCFAGDKKYEKMMRILDTFIEEKKLKPILTLVPGRVRQGASKKKKIPLLAKSKKIEFVAGSTGILTVQFLVKGVSAAPISRFSSLDPSALASAIITKIAESEILWESTSDFPLMPPIFTNLQTEKVNAPGRPAGWAGFIASFFYDENEPSVILSHLRTIIFEVFSKFISQMHKQFNSYIEQTKGAVKKSTLTSFKPKVVSYRELKKECTKEIPELILPENPTGQEVQDAAFNQTLIIAENSSYRDEPFVAYSLVPPIMPNYKLDANILVWPILKRALKESGGRLTPWGMLDTVWQREMFENWGSKNFKLWQDESPISNSLEGFSPKQNCTLGPVVAFGPDGFDEGLKTEKILIDPTFTKLPELLKSLILRVQTLEEHTSFLDKFKKKFRSITSRLGFSKVVDDFDEDDEFTKDEENPS